MSVDYSKRRFTVNRYIKTGFILGVLQFLIFYSGYDYLLHLGPFVAHHFIELPAFFMLGRGFSRFFADHNLSSLVSQILNLLIFVLNLVVAPGGMSFSGMLVGFIVSFPELIGFYSHRF